VRRDHVPLCELTALEQRMIAAAPIVLEATAEVSDDAGGLADGDTDAERDGGGCADDVDGASF
jgi:hypothetical protein